MAYSSIVKPSVYFNTKLYTGNGGTQSITGVGFQPDWTWIKNRDNTDNHVLYDAVRGATKRIQSNLDNVESTKTNGVTSFDSNGFSVGSANENNNNGQNIVSWNWKAGTGQGSSNTDGSINTTYTSVNTTAGFSIVKWTGTGSASTLGHGLGVAPKMIIMKRTSGAVNDWVVYHESVGNNKALFLNVVNTPDTDSAYFNDTSPTSSVFSVKSTQTNNNGDNQIAYCFAEKTGYSKFGSYTGNGNADGPFIYTGFKPAFLIQKSIDTTVDWQMHDTKREPSNTGQYSRLEPNASNAEATDSIGYDFYSNGFKARTSHNAYNGSGTNFIYMAFAEEPLVANSGNGVPATAR